MQRGREGDGRMEKGPEDLTTGLTIMASNFMREAARKKPRK